MKDQKEVELKTLLAKQVDGPKEESKVQEKKVEGWKRVLGLILIMGDNSMLTLSYTLTKLLLRQTDRFTTFEIFAARTVGQFICQETYNYFVNRQMKNSDTSNEEQKQITYRSLTRFQLSLLLLRICLSYPSWLMIYYSLGIVPVGLAQTIQNFTPFIVLIMSHFTLKEQLPSIEIINMIVSFIGSLLIILNSSKESTSIDTKGSLFLGSLCVLFATIAQSAVYIILRYLKPVHHTLVASFQIKGNLLLSNASFLIYRLWINPNNFTYDMKWGQFGLLFGNGAVMFLCQIWFIMAMQLDKASRAAGLTFTSIVMGYTVDVFLFDYQMCLMEVIGAVIIIGGSAMIIALKYFQYIK